MSLAGGIVLTERDIYSTGTTQEHQYGAVGMDTHGDVYRYVKAGASAVSAGKLQIAPAPKTNHHNIAVASAAAADALQVTVTLGATAAVANEYAGGMMVINDADGEGVAYRIAGHPAADSAGSLTLTLERGLTEALTTSSEVTLVHNHYNGVVEGTDEERKPVGIAVVDIASGSFGWVKSRGIAPALADETLNLGALLTVGSSTAGAVEEMDDLTTNITDYFVGFAIVAGVDTEYRPIELAID